MGLCGTRFSEGFNGVNMQRVVLYLLMMIAMAFCVQKMAFGSSFTENNIDLLQMKARSTSPAAASTSKVKVYPKTDNQLYIIDSTSNETEVGHYAGSNSNLANVAMKRSGSSTVDISAINFKLYGSTESIPTPNTGYIAVACKSSDSTCYTKSSDGTETAMSGGGGGGGSGTFVGAVVISACTSTFFDNATIAWGSFTAQASCTYTTYGSASAPGTNIPAIKFASLAAGTYLFVYEGLIGSGSAGKICYTRFYDGTQAALEESEYLGGGGSSLSSTMTGTMIYASTQTNVTIEIQKALDSGGSCYVYNGGSGGNTGSGGTATGNGVIKVFKM